MYLIHPNKNFPSPQNPRLLRPATGTIFLLILMSLIKNYFMPLPVAKSIHQHFLKHPFFKTSLDRYLKWIPYALVPVLNIFGFRTRSGWKKQMLIAGIAESTRYLIVDNLKKITKEHRPAPYISNHSFPSGHTSSSFAGAEFMHQELRSSSPILSCIGYMAATATAIIRLEKNKHWLKDVVCGAAIGVLSAKLAYYVVNKSRNRRKHISPTGSGNPEKNDRIEKRLNISSLT